MFSRVILSVVAFLLIGALPAMAHEIGVAASGNSESSAPLMVAGDFQCSVKNGNRQLCAVRLDSGVLEWQIRSAGKPLQVIGTSGGEGQILSEFLLDSHFQYVAIITSEEGHPMLSVFRMSDWITRYKQPTPLYFLNPYPGSLSLHGWDEHASSEDHGIVKTGLLFSSDGPVLVADAQHGADFPLAEERNYRLDVVSGRISVAQ